MNAQEHARALVVQVLGQLTLQTIEQQAQVSALTAELQSLQNPQSDPTSPGETTVKPSPR